MANTWSGRFFRSKASGRKIRNDFVEEAIERAQVLRNFHPTCMLFRDMDKVDMARRRWANFFGMFLLQNIGVALKGEDNSALSPQVLYFCQEEVLRGNRFASLCFGDLIDCGLGNEDDTPLSVRFASFLIKEHCKVDLSPKVLMDEWDRYGYRYTVSMLETLPLSFSERYGLYAQVMDESSARLS